MVFSNPNVCKVNWTNLLIYQKLQEIKDQHFTGRKLNSNQLNYNKSKKLALAKNLGTLPETMNNRVDPIYHIFPSCYFIWSGSHSLIEMLNFVMQPKSTQHSGCWHIGISASLLNNASQAAPKRQETTELVKDKGDNA